MWLKLLRDIRAVEMLFFSDRLRKTNDCGNEVVAQLFFKFFSRLFVCLLCESELNSGSAVCARELRIRWGLDCVGDEERE